MSRKQPWFKDGLNFTCTQCGNCCTGEAGVVWVDDDEIAAIAEHLGKTVGQVRLFQTRLVGNRASLTEYANGDCVFFDGKSRQCRIYPIRPRQCQSWPFWRSNIESPQTWKAVQKVCPGTNQTAFVSLEQIQAEATRIDI